MCEAGQREVSRGIRGSGPELRLNSRCWNGLDCGSDVAAGRVAIRGARRGGDGAVAEQSQEDRDATRPDAIHLQVGKAVSTDTRESEGLRQRVCTSSNTCICHTKLRQIQLRRYRYPHCPWVCSVTVHTIKHTPYCPSHSPCTPDYP